MVQAKPHLPRCVEISSTTEREIMKNIELLGMPLSRYQILYEGAHPATSEAAARLQKQLKKRCNVSLSLVKKQEKDGTYIRFCALGRQYGEGELYLCGKNILICGDDVVGLSATLSHLIACLSKGDEVTADMLCRKTALQPREVYAADPDAFLPCHRGMYALTVEPRTLAQKRAVLKDPTGRPFVIAHRGEHIFYPENSLESTISAWHGGADAVEIDIQKSADGIWMCMHDTDVTRTTNAKELLGTSGYPTSPLLCDWTYAQLRTLRLKDANGTQTPFLIPTLEEMLRVCDGRIYAHLDKAFSLTEDIFPYIEKLGIFDCVYLVNHVNIHDILLHKDHFSSRGIRLDNLLRPRREMTLEKSFPLLLENLSHLTPAFIPHGDYVGHSEQITALIRNHKDRVRFGAWFLRDFDTEDLWQKAHTEGISIFMTDHPFDLISLL